MKDISSIFESAIKKKNNYNPRVVSKEIEEILNIWCRIEDDSRRTWYTISLSNGKTVLKEYGYLSCVFPVAFLNDNCPPVIYDILYKHNVLCEKLCSSFFCKPEILEHYINTKELALIDDRFMDDDSFPFDEEIFLKIDEGVNYINPYKFSFEDLK